MVEDDGDELSGVLLNLMISICTIGNSWDSRIHHCWYSPAVNPLLASISFLKNTAAVFYIAEMTGV